MLKLSVGTLSIGLALMALSGIANADKTQPAGGNSKSCKGPAVVGQTPTTNQNPFGFSFGQAFQLAKDDWSAKVTNNFGSTYSDYAKSIQKNFVCIPNAGIGNKIKSCTITAIPCAK